MFLVVLLKTKITKMTTMKFTSISLAVRAIIWAKSWEWSSPPGAGLVAPVRLAGWEGGGEERREETIRRGGEGLVRGDLGKRGDNNVRQSVSC